MSHGIIQPTNIDKVWIAADPAAALVGYISTILAVFGVFDRLGLNADQVAILGGAVLGVMATLRALWERHRRRPPKPSEASDGLDGGGPSEEGGTDTLPGDSSRAVRSIGSVHDTNTQDIPEVSGIARSDVGSEGGRTSSGLK